MTLPTGKSVILQFVGGTPAWNFYQRHGIGLHRKRELDGITHALFVHEGQLVPTIPAVVGVDVVALDEVSIARRALSSDASERRIGIALMQATAEGFTHSEARLFMLSAEPGSQHVTFKPNKVGDVLGKSEVSNDLINSLLKAGR